MKLAVLILSAATLLNAQQSDNENKKIVCYYTNWSSYRPSNTSYTARNISPFLCTHVIYSFVGFDVENDGMKSIDEFQDITRNGFNEFSDLKIYNEKLKNLVAIGGWREGSATFSSIAASKERRLNFARNAIQFMRKYSFDGINIDWQFPGFREGSRPEDYENFVTLIKVMKEQFDIEPNVTADARLILTMSVPANTDYIDKGFDLPKLQLYSEFITILCYDYHFSTDSFVNHHSPIYPLIDEVGDHPNAKLNVDYTVNYIVDKGVQREKLVLGIPAFGRTYILEDESMNDIGSLSSDQGEAGKDTREIGYKAYYEICVDNINENWTVVHKNRTAMGPYAYKGNSWVAYDDPESAKLKGEYARDHNLGGIMFWAIDDDDFKGLCGRKGNPLIKAAREGFFSPSPSKNEINAQILTSNPQPSPQQNPQPSPQQNPQPSPQQNPQPSPQQNPQPNPRPNPRPNPQPAPPREVPRPGFKTTTTENLEGIEVGSQFSTVPSVMRSTRNRLRPNFGMPISGLRPQNTVDITEKPVISVSRTKTNGEQSFLQNISVWIVNNIFHLGMKNDGGVDIDISF